MLFEFFVYALVSGLDVADSVDEVIQSGILVFFLLIFEVFELFSGHVVSVVLFLELNDKNSYGLLPSEVGNVIVGLFLEEGIVSALDTVFVTKQSIELGPALSKLLGVKVEIFGIGLIAFDHFLKISDGGFLE